MARKVIHGILIALLGVSLLGAGQGTRFDKLGHELVCTCGCNQILLDCNHVGCPASDGMRKELQARLDQNLDGDQVFAFFVEKYGPTVLAAPTTTGFNRVAWITPYAMLALGMLLSVYFIRMWRRRMQGAAVPAAPSEAMLERIRQETQI
jgi:cytochrome c-type biogenesis protein CcmH/NrfF